MHVQGYSWPGVGGRPYVPGTLQLLERLEGGGDNCYFLRT